MTINNAATDYCNAQISHYKTKANHNKKESLLVFRVLMISTLSVPLLLTLGTEPWITKILPAILSSIAAFCTAWLQQRRPQELWSLYRTAEKRLDDQLIQYSHKIGEYEDCSDPEKILVKNVSRISNDTHNKWMPLVQSVGHFNKAQNDS